MEYINTLNKAILYIERNLTNEIDISKICKELLMNDQEFRWLFSFVFSTTISEYIRKRRLYESGVLIANTDELIGDIASRYQYFNHSAFSRAFKDFHNHSPLEIREKGVNYLRVYLPLIIERKENMDFNIIELPATRMARSGKHSLKGFDKWWSDKYDKSKSIFPKDFMWNNEVTKKLEWLYIVSDDEETDKYETFQFPGGIYATITSDDTSKEKSKAYFTLLDKISKNNEYEKSTVENDPNYHLKYPMGHVSTPKGFDKHQFTIFVPIIKKNK
jgi:AraC-like DNA-binding protein